MDQLFFQIILFFLKASMAFVPQGKYQAKVDAIVTMDQKNQGCDLQGWEYRKINSPTGFIHRYYYYPSTKPNAPYLLLIHGLNLDGRTYLNFKSLSDEFQLVAYDLPEKCDCYHGSFEDFMKLVNEFVDLLDAHNCSIVGVSFGGGIALRLAATHPDIRTSRLVLISTGIVGTNPEEKRRNHAMAEWIRKQPDFKLYWLMEKVFAASKGAFESDSLHDTRKILRVKQVDFYRQVAYSMADHDAVADAKKVKCPVLLLSGDKEKVFTPDQIAAIKEFIPQAEYELIPGGTHDMVYARGEEIAGHLKAFFARHPSQ
jgi:pimeloyl-ACP methyl ester carboxylesterase